MRVDGFFCQECGTDFWIRSSSVEDDGVTCPCCQAEVRVQDDDYRNFEVNVV